jgi:hypothetical protein
MSKINNRPKTMKDLVTAFSETLQLPDIAQRTMKSLTSIITVLTIILETGGKPGWYKEVNKRDLGQTLDAKDEETLEPLVRFITALPDHSSKKNLLEPFFMSGGNGDSASSIDINGPYYKFVQTIKGLDATMGTTAVIPRIEEAADCQPDPKPLTALKGLLIPLVGPQAAFYIGETPVPVRLAVAIGHTLLDVVRLLVSMPGMDIPILRQAFSIALAGFEFYRGEWKQSLLSGAGILSQTAMYSGFFAKVLLNMFSLISPNLQDDIIYGAYSVTKSMAVGALLKLFQITATEDTRKKTTAFFKAVVERDKKIDQSLKEVKAEQKGGDAPYVGPDEAPTPTPSMSTIQGIQSASQDWTLTCSKEFKQYIDTDPFKDNDILKLLFQLLNMPTNKDEIDIKCKNLKRHMDVNGYLTFKDLLIFEAGMTGAMMADDSEPKEGDSDEKIGSSSDKAEDLLGVGRLNAVKGEGGTEKTATATATETKTETKTPTGKSGGSRRFKRSFLSSSRKRKTPRKLPRH